jgi:hypothetical protein
MDIPVCTYLLLAKVAFTEIETWKEYLPALPAGTVKVPVVELNALAVSSTTVAKFVMLANPDPIELDGLFAITDKLVPAVVTIFPSMIACFKVLLIERAET